MVKPKEKAARVVAHLTAEAPFDANEQDNRIRTASASEGNFPEANAFSLADFEAAFPGQIILPNGMPNRPRLAMRWAQAMIRAVAVDDILVAEIYMRRMIRVCSPLLVAEGLKT